MPAKSYIALKETTLKDRKNIQEEAMQSGISERLRALKSRRSSATAIWWLGTDTLFILGAFWMASFSNWLVAPSMLLLASRLRALGNLLHDTSHGNLISSTRWNIFIGRFILAPATFEGWETYREAHGEHHSELGTPCDPDIVPTDYIKGYGWARFGIAFLKTFINWKFWVGSMFAGWVRLKKHDLLPMYAFWSVVVLAPTFVFGANAVANGLVLLIVTRATVYHLLRVFWEMADHAFLEPVSEVEFSRTLPGQSPLTWLLHPHHDNYHLAHHLFPTIPLCQLPVAHSILLICPTYAATEICDGYMFGSKSVLRSFAGSRYSSGR